jgi:HD superfamily phosphodiesterase
VNDSSDLRRWPVRLAVCALWVSLSASAVAGAGPDAAPSEPGWRVVVRKFAGEHFLNPAWGYSHCRRDYELARTLAAADAVRLDDDVLFAAAYLHDIAAFPSWAKEGVDHADQATVVVEPVLRDAGFPMAKLDAVQAAIRTHMFDRDPLTPEAVYLHDADALDWLGSIGVARIVALVDPNGGNPTGPQVMAMLESNLAKVPDRVLSRAGRAIVSERKAELEAFLRTLRRESDEFRTL